MHSNTPLPAFRRITLALIEPLAVAFKRVGNIIKDGTDAPVDPALFEIIARVKKAEDVDYVRERILETVKAFQEKPVDVGRLDTVRKRLRYQVALSMDNSDTIAQILSSYVALTRTPETMNALYDQYSKLTPEDVRQAAAKYLVEKGRTIVTLTGPGGAK